MSITKEELISLGFKVTGENDDSFFAYTINVQLYKFSKMSH